MPDTAENGQMAVSMLEKGLAKPCGCPDRAYRLVFMDIEMPQMNGIEATEAIFNILGRRNKDMCRVVAVTAHTSGETKTDCLAAGMSQVLGKPVNPDHFWEAVMKYFYRLSEKEISQMRK